MKISYTFVLVGGCQVGLLFRRCTEFCNEDTSLILTLLECKHWSETCILVHSIPQTNLKFKISPKFGPFYDQNQP